MSLLLLLGKQAVPAGLINIKQGSATRGNVLVGPRRLLVVRRPTDSIVITDTVHRGLKSRTSTATLAGVYLGETDLVGFTERGPSAIILRPDSMGTGGAFGVVTLFSLLIDAVTVQPNVKVTSPVLLVGRDRLLSAVRLRVDGMGGRQTGTAVARAVIYNEQSGLVAESEEVEIEAGSPPTWRSFTFRAPPLVAGTYEVGIHVGGPSNIVRALTLTGGRSRIAVDTYGDGASDPFGDFDPATNRIRSYLTTFPRYTPPRATDRYYGRLPLTEAELALTTGTTQKFVGHCGWHGDSVDKEVGSFAIVRQGGPFESLLGHRIKVRQRGGHDHVVAFVHLFGDVVDDLSLTRRLFARIADLTADPIHVEIEVLQ
jgi:hypothetical protein